MKKQNFSAIRERSRFKNSLLVTVSATAVIGLSACGQGSVEDFQASLEDGESIDITLSTNDDDDLVISFPDDGTGDGPDDGIDDGANATGDGAIYALTNQHDPSQQISSSEDAASEPERVNQIAAVSYTHLTLPTICSV